MQLKTVIVIVAAVLSVALGVLTQWLEPGPYLTGAVLILLLAYGVRVFHPIVRRSPRYDPVPRELRGPISRWIFVGGLPYVAWVVVVAVGVDWKGWTGLLLGLPLISWLVWICATGLENLRMSRYDDFEYRAAMLDLHQSRNAAVVPTVSEVLGNESMMLKRAQQVMREVLALTGDYAYLVVEMPRKVSDHCMVVPVRIPSKVAAQLAQQEADEKNGIKTSSKGVASFGPASATAVAIAFGEKAKTPIPRGWVEIEPTEFYGRYNIIVLSRDVMADVIVWYDDPTPTLMDNPALISYYKDGTENRMSLRGNGLIVAMSQAGKTNIIMLMLLEHYLRCLDVVVWVAGKRKQGETFLPLLAAYAGTDFPIPIDFIVNGQKDTVSLLICALHIVDYRNSLPDRSGLKTIKIIIDEYADVVEDKSVLGYYKGEWLDAATCVRRLNRVGKSVFVEADIATHRDTNSMLGTDGGDLRSGTDYTIALRTNEAASLHRLYDDYSLEPLVYQGELYAARTAVRPRRSKAPYIREVGKPNAPKTDGPTVTEAGWSRRHLVAERQLTPAEQHAAGPFYLARHTHMTPELEHYLRFGPPPEKQPETTPQKAVEGAPRSIPITGPDPAEAGRQHALAEIARIEAEWAAAAQGAPAAAPSPQPQEVPTLNAARHKRGRPAAILRLLAERPMTVAQLMERMQAEGDPISDKQLIYNALAKLREQQLVQSQEVDGEVIHERVGAA